MPSPRLRCRLAAATLILSTSLLAASCGDGTPAFCSTLREQSDLAALGAALDEGDLDAAGDEARQLEELADEAPAQIRGDLRELGDAVVQIVDLLATERDDAEVEGADPGAPGEADQRRQDLNERLGELDERSRRVSAWALEECGLALDAAGG